MRNKYQFSDKDVGSCGINISFTIGNSREHLYSLQANFVAETDVLNSPVTGEFPAQRPVTRSFDVFFEYPVGQTVVRLVIWDGHLAYYVVTVLLLDGNLVPAALHQCRRSSK